MILSPKIEELALKGKCVWRTFNTGVTSTYTIPVPLGSFILLRQIIIYPFIAKTQDINKRSDHTVQLSIVDQGGQNEINYIVRMTPRQVTTDSYPGEPIQLETWQTFKKLACIDLGLIPKATTFTYSGNALISQQAQERTSPLGYDGVLNIPSVEIGETPGKVLYPTGESRQYTGVPYINSIIDRMRWNFNSNSKIPAVSGSSVTSDFEFPIITFGYWEFKNAIPEELF